MEIKLRPFMTPNFVTMELPPGQRQDGINFDRGSIPLKDVPAEDLERLCAQFREEVFRKAGKTLQVEEEGEPRQGGEPGTALSPASESAFRGGVLQRILDIIAQWDTHDSPVAVEQMCEIRDLAEEALRAAPEADGRGAP